MGVICEASHSSPSAGTSANSRTVRSSSARVMLHLTQVLMHELNRHRSFADAGCHALHGSVADIADGEHARQAGLKKAGIPFQRPVFGRLAITHQIGAGEDEPVRVAIHEVL